ncbi:MAG TPA: hypothetical protein VK530_03785, partial [Candidatus Acidoferrum sp.]|nr:hypothetical protein [Candidatus Acidoferrum sp.]
HDGVLIARGRRFKVQTTGRGRTLNFEVETLTRIFRGVSVNPESPLDRLWQEYAVAFKDYDDLTLARWMAQTLGQLEGKVWRLSHPLVGAYRLASQVARDRGMSVQRMATFPAAYNSAECCGSPLVPLLTRDVKEAGLGCPHCGGTAVPSENLSGEARDLLLEWADEYAPVHAVAHWDEEKQKRVADYNSKLEDAAEKAEDLLAEAGFELAPKLLDQFPAVIWEDQDECLEVRPEDIPIE